MNGIWTAALIYVAVVVLLAKASTLMYQTTKAPNFSVGLIMVLGAFSGVIFIRILDYPSIVIIFPVAFITGTIIGLFESLIIIEPLIKRGRNPVYITLSTIGVGLVLLGLMQICNYWLETIFSPTRGLLRYRLFLKEFEFTIGGISMTLLISNITVLLIVFLFWYMYEHTRFGSVIRGLSENSELLQIQGLNPVKLRTIIWVLAGGFAGLAGAFLVMWFHTSISIGFGMLTTIFAASLVGGFDNPKGAVIGGVIVGLSEIIWVMRWQALIRPWVGEWRFVIPFFFIIIVTAFRPQGFLGQNFGDNQLRIKAITRGQFFLVFLIIFMVNSAFDVACRVNLSRTQDSLIAEFEDYEVIVVERDRDVVSIRCNDFMSFQQQLVQYNISKVYVEPYSDLEKYFSFYFERNDWFYRVDVVIEHYGTCQYRYDYE